MKDKNKPEISGKKKRLFVGIVTVILIIAVGMINKVALIKMPNINAVYRIAERFFTKEQPMESVLPEEMNVDTEKEQENIIQENVNRDAEEKEEIIEEKRVVFKPSQSTLLIELQPEDVTVLEGSKSSFRCYSNIASETGMYEWQHYSREKSEWETIGAITSAGKVSEVPEGIVLSLKEENGKRQSVLTITESGIDKDGYLIRCNVYDDVEKQYHCTTSKPAMLQVIRRKFEELIINYSQVCEAGTVIDINDIDIGFRYADGKVVFAKLPLEDIHFLVDKVVKRDVKNNADGSITESTTTSASEEEKYEVALGNNEIDVRCRFGEKSARGTFSVKGVDFIVPRFTEVTTSETALSNNQKKSAVIAFSLKGIDNYTSEDELEYALAEKGIEVTDEDYSTEKMYARKIQDNTVYVAYVKDICGNISSKEIPIHIKDDVPPVIDRVELENPDSNVYCAQNEIRVSAHDDVSDIEYRYTLNTSEEKGMWSNDNSYNVNQNGSFLVEVRDLAGNITSQTIEVQNIDNVSPIIKSISTLRKINIAGSNGEIIGYDMDGNPIYGTDGTEENVIGYSYDGEPIYKTDSENLIGYKNSGERIYGIYEGGISMGLTGIDGADGQDSINGKDGKDGKDGINGEDGKDGVDGEDGKDGKDGVDGKDGKDGKDGTDGEDGKDGAAGADGLSTFMVFSQYANGVDDSGNARFEAKPSSSTKYMGVASVSGSKAPTDPSQYTWSQYKDLAISYQNESGVPRLVIH